VRDFFLLYKVQTGSGAHPASYPKVTGGDFPGKSSRGVNLTTHLNLVPRSRMMELYLRPYIYLHGIEPN
jgi:hypothetical protein